MKTQFQMYKYNSESFQIVDGFDKEGSPCFIVLNQPRIGNGSFAGIKPAVIILNSVPEDYNQELVSLKQSCTDKSSLLDSISDLKPTLKTPAFKVQRDIIQTPKQVKQNASSFTLNFENKNMAQSSPQIATIKMYKLKDSQKIQQNTITNEEDDESDDCIERELNQTQSEIISDIVTYKGNMDCNQSSNINLFYKSPDNQTEKVLSSFLMDQEFENGNDRAHLITQQLEKPKTAMSRNDSKHSFSQSNSSFENLYTNHPQTSKNSHRKMPGKKHKNQSLYDNLQLIERANMYQSSRFIQCSLNFSKYLRNMIISRSPTKKGQNIDEKIVEANQQNATQQRKVSAQLQSYQQKVNSVRNNKKSAVNINIDKGNDLLGKKRIDVKKRRETVTEFEKQKAKDRTTTILPKSNYKPKDSAQKNKSISRYEKKSGVSGDNNTERKNSPLHERIARQGSVLNRKTSVYHQKTQQSITSQLNEAKLPNTNLFTLSQMSLKSCCKPVAQPRNAPITQSMCNSNHQTNTVGTNQIQSPRGSQINSGRMFKK